MLERFARILIITAMVAPAAFAIDAPQPLEPLPSPRQLAWHNDELTMFIHFGMNTFTGLGTGKGDEDEKLLNPTQLDCKQWVRVARKMASKV